MFKTQNYTIVWCEKCNERTTIEPGRSFEKLNCKCNAVKEEVANGTSPKPRATRTKKEQG